MGAIRDAILAGSSRCGTDRVIVQGRDQSQWLALRKRRIRATLDNIAESALPGPVIAAPVSSSCLSVFLSFLSFCHFPLFYPLASG